jgi:hypothetical protein
LVVCREATNASIEGHDRDWGNAERKQVDIVKISPRWLAIITGGKFAELTANHKDAGAQAQHDAALSLQGVQACALSVDLPEVVNRFAASSIGQGLERSVQGAVFVETGRQATKAQDLLAHRDHGRELGTLYGLSLSAPPAGARRRGLPKHSFVPARRGVQVAAGQRASGQAAGACGSAAAGEAESA